MSKVDFRKTCGFRLSSTKICGFRLSSTKMARHVVSGSAQQKWQNMWFPAQLNKSGKTCGFRLSSTKMASVLFCRATLSLTFFPFPLFSLLIRIKRVHSSTANFHNKWLFIKIKRKNGKKLFNSCEISKNIISKFSGRLLISQNDSLDVLLLDEYILRLKRVEMIWPIHLGANLTNEH